MPIIRQIMRRYAVFFVMILTLYSCATKIHEPGKPSEPPRKSAEPEIRTLEITDAPPPNRFKQSRELKLVRAMEGGACNSKDQGARGLFLLYAEPNDIERIKKEKGSQIFQQFESDIEAFSLQAFQQTVAAINISNNPFALDDDDAQRQVAESLESNFKEFAAPLIKDFENESSLMIDVVPFSPSMVFLLQDCSSELSQAPPSN